MSSFALASTRQHVWHRWVLFGTPLMLGVLELGHPLLNHEDTIGMLRPIAAWWIVLHLLLVPLFVLMGWTFFLLLRGVENRAATLSRYATVVYVAFSIGYDTMVGLGSGIMVSTALPLPSAQQVIVQQTLRGLYTNPATLVSYYILLGSGLVAIGAMLWALAQEGVPLVPLLVLAGTGFSAYSHALPFGPMGSVCFLLAALWIELVWRRSREQKAEVSAAEPALQGRK